MTCGIIIVINIRQTKKHDFYDIFFTTTKLKEIVKLIQNKIYTIYKRA